MTQNTYTHNTRDERVSSFVLFFLFSLEGFILGKGGSNWLLCFGCAGWQRSCCLCGLELHAYIHTEVVSPFYRYHGGRGSDSAGMMNERDYGHGMLAGRYGQGVESI